MYIKCPEQDYILFSLKSGRADPLEMNNLKFQF